MSAAICQGNKTAERVWLISFDLFTVNLEKLQHLIDSREGAGPDEAAEDIREGVISVVMFQRREKGWEQSSRLRDPGLEPENICLHFET